MWTSERSANMATGPQNAGTPRLSASKIGDHATMCRTVTQQELRLAAGKPEARPARVGATRAP